MKFDLVSFLLGAVVATVILLIIARIVVDRKKREIRSRINALNPMSPTFDPSTFRDTLAQLRDSGIIDNVRPDNIQIPIQNLIRLIQND